MPNLGSIRAVAVKQRQIGTVKAKKSSGKSILFRLLRWISGRSGQVQIYFLHFVFLQSFSGTVKTGKRPNSQSQLRQDVLWRRPLTARSSVSQREILGPRYKPLPIYITVYCSCVAPFSAEFQTVNDAGMIGDSPPFTSPLKSLAITAYIRCSRLGKLISLASLSPSPLSCRRL